MSDQLNTTDTGGNTEESASSLSSIRVMETVIPPMTIGELTEVKEDGLGVLDVLLRNLSLHLDKQWEQERITGPEYARVFTDLYQNTLQAAIDYTSRRARLGYEILNLQNDAEYKQAQIEIAKEQLKKVPHEIAILVAQEKQITAETDTRLPAEVANLQKQGEVLTQQVAESTYRVANMLPKELEQMTAQISNLTTQGLLVSAQTDQVTAETNNLEREGEILFFKVQEADYRVTEMLPKELELMAAQVDQAAAELTKVSHQINILKAQEGQIVAETSLTGVRTEAETANLAKIPVEVEVLRKEALRADAQISLTNKQVEQITAELTKIPVEIEILNVQRDAAEAGIEQTNAQTERIIQETTQKLPLEVANLQKQGLHLEAETLLTTNQSELAALQATKIPTEISVLQAEVANKAKQNLILEREYELKVGELQLQEKNITLAAAEIELRREELLVKKAQVTAQEAQSELYAQKVVTEKAQTDNSVVKPESVIDLSNQVLKAQVKGYSFDAQNRLAKLMVDVFSTTYQQGDRSVNETNKLTDTQVGQVFTKMFTELGIS